MQHQSLYRRFRPQRFAEVVGQGHMIRALRNAVSEDRVGHAYLLSGPRGTGKTSTARILAKALNCESLGDDGEPCGGCDSCGAVASGLSMDLIELDAASNNSVNHIRDLTEKAALASPGRRKVYLLDEVHMLSAAASNALLKTLEEPPPHVVFILATTDPQKVLPTIRSRTQQFELSLVDAGEMASHIRAIAEAADAPINDEIVDYATECGQGSVRDALSALDTVLAAGGIPDDRTDVGALVQALANGDLTAALLAVAEAISAGVDARDLAERAARRLRDVFLAGAGAMPAELPPSEAAAAREMSDVMGRRANVRTLEALGEALAHMPQSADRRLTLETALVGLLADDLLGADAPTAAAAAAAPRSGERQARSARPAEGPAAARAAMAAAKPPPQIDATPPSVGPAVPPPPAAPRAPSSSQALPPEAAERDEAPASASPGSAIGVAELQSSWAAQIASRLKPHAQGLYVDAVVVGVEHNVVTVQLPHQNLLDRARRRKNEVEAVLSDHLDRTIRVEVKAAPPPAAGAASNPAPAPAPSGSPPPSAGAESSYSPDEGDLVTKAAGGPAAGSGAAQPAGAASGAATSVHDSKVQRIVEHFPGSVVVHLEADTS